MKREAQRDRDEVLAADDLGLQFLRLRADLRAFDVVLRQVAVEFRVARVAVVAPAGGEQEVHDVQAEAEVAGPVFLSSSLPAAMPLT